MPEVNNSKCKVRQYSDSMSCVCGLGWDVNDPDPPVCPATQQQGQGSGVGAGNTDGSPLSNVSMVYDETSRFVTELPEGITRLLAPRPPASAPFANVLIRLQHHAARRPDQGRGVEPGTVRLSQRDLQDLLRDWHRLDDIVRADTGKKRCYQCNAKVNYLFPDSRCSECTRTNPETF